MRAFRFALVAVVFAGLPLFARDVPTLSAVAPNAIQAASGEWWITLQGTHFLPTAGVQVIFTGPAGTVSIAPNASTDTSMDVWLPEPVVLAAGNYSVVVRAPGVADSNPVTLTVSGKSIIIKVPPFILAEAIDLKGGPAQFEVTATSFLTDQVTIDCTHRSGELFPFEKTEVDCTATDEFGETDKGSFTVTVADTQPPQLITPDDQLAFGKLDGAVVFYEASAKDVVDPEVRIACAPESGSLFRLGTSAVDCSSIDRFGNESKKTFRVHVGTDTIPAMVIPTGIADEAESREGAVVKYEASATTADGKPAEVKCDPPSGSLFTMGTTSVKCIAWGPGGESTTDFFDVTVADTKPPVLFLPRDMSEQAPSLEGAFVKYDVTATDAVDGATAVSCFPESGSLFPAGQTVVNCTSSDSLRHVANGSFLVTVVPWEDETVYLIGGGSSSQ